MATKRVWAGSALSLYIFFFRAFASGNDNSSLDVQPSSPPSVATTLTSAEKAHPSGNYTLSVGVQPSSSPSVATKFTSAEHAFASGNDNSSLDVQPSSPPSVATTLTSAEKDGVKTTKLGTTVLPFDDHHTNEGTTGVPFTVNSVTSDTYKKTTSASKETNLDERKDEKTEESFKYDDKWDDPFKYDYSSLRQAGLTLATVLFLLGIMVITCGKMRCRRRCHMSKGRSYDVTRM
ncbi:hypothetical protein AMELA_G00104960 [Ameiurus melas]|uniref:FXYD domain-containing ion transport regulator n=1 Tax=Ameiurus melas TaxID=219545 RepID=A0A7J6AW12_AMEME|nr:hypothetical protein AMELA_G00104960 [Ameiurus melas]